MTSTRPPVDYIERTRAQYAALGYPPYQWVERTTPPPWAELAKPVSGCRLVVEPRGRLVGARGRRRRDPRGSRRRAAGAGLTHLASVRRTDRSRDRKPRHTHAVDDERLVDHALREPPARGVSRFPART